MSKKDLLKKKAMPKLATSVQTGALAVISKQGNLKAITLEIRSSLDELRDIADWWKVKKERAAELKQVIIEKLKYVRDHKKKLLGNRTFEEYLTEDIGLSKGYFYEQLQAYNLCVEYQAPDLYKDVDHKVLVKIARVKDKDYQKELIGKAPSLSRDFFKKVSRTDFSDESEDNTEQEEDSFIAMVNKDTLSIRVSDSRILQQIESLLRSNGITVKYTSD